MKRAEVDWASKAQSHRARLQILRFAIGVRGKLFPGEKGLDGWVGGWMDESQGSRMFNGFLGIKMNDASKIVYYLTLQLMEE